MIGYDFDQDFERGVLSEFNMEFGFSIISQTVG